MTQRIVMVTPDESLTKLVENVALAQKELESFLHYVNKTSLEEMLQDELGKNIIKSICDAALGVSCYSGILQNYAKGEAKLGTEKEWMEYLDHLIEGSSKYTQSQMDEAIVQAAAASARSVIQAYDNNMKYLPEAVKDPIVDEAIVAAQKKYTQKDLDDAIAALATGKKYEITDGDEPFRLIDDSSSTAPLEP